MLYAPYFSNVLLTYSTDYFCKEARPGYTDQWDTTKQKIAIIYRLIEQGRPHFSHHGFALS